MLAGATKTLAVLAIFLVVDPCWAHTLPQQGEYTDRWGPLGDCPHNVSTELLEIPNWRKEAAAREEKVHLEPTASMYECLYHDPSSNGDNEQSNWTVIWPEANEQPPTGSTNRPLEGIPTVSQTLPTMMPSIRNTMVPSIANYNSCRYITTNTYIDPPPLPHRMRPHPDPVASADGHPVDFAPMEEDYQMPIAARTGQHHQEAGPSGTTAGPSGTTAGSQDTTAAPPDASAAPPATTPPAPYKLPTIKEKYVDCIGSDIMLQGIEDQLEVCKDRTPDAQVDMDRMEMAHKLIQAAAKWEDTPPIGVDYPGSRHAELALAFISILQHPLVTGNSISFSRLRYPVPKEIVYQNIVPHRTDGIVEKMNTLARSCGKIPATITAVPNKDRVNLVVTCADGEKMAKIIVALASSSSAHGLHTVKESIMDLEGKRHQRPATWSPVFPMEQNSATVRDITENNLNTARHHHEYQPPGTTPPPPCHRETPRSGSPTCPWGRACNCSPWPGQRHAPQSSTRTGQLRQLPDRLWPSLRQPSWTSSSWALTPGYGGLTPARNQPCRTGRCCSTSLGTTNHRYESQHPDKIKPILTQTQYKQPQPLIMQVLQINHLIVADPRLGKYTACMESAVAIRALPDCGPIIMFVPDRFSMIAVADRSGRESHFRYAVDFYIGEEMDANLIRKAARKAIAKALDLKLAELRAQKLDEPDPSITLLLGALGKDSVTIKRSELADASLDEAVLMDTGITLAAHIARKLPNPTTRIVLRGDTKLDAYPLLLTGKPLTEAQDYEHDYPNTGVIPARTSRNHTIKHIMTGTVNNNPVDAGANETDLVHNGSLPMWSSMHYNSIVGAVNKKELADRQRWLDIHLVALSTDTPTRTVAALEIAEEEVHQAKLNLLKGDGWADKAELSTRPLPKAQIVSIDKHTHTNHYNPTNMQVTDRIPTLCCSGLRRRVQEGGRAPAMPPGRTATATQPREPHSKCPPGSHVSRKAPPTPQHIGQGDGTANQLGGEASSNAPLTCSREADTPRGNARLPYSQVHQMQGGLTCSKDRPHMPLHTTLHQGVSLGQTLSTAPDSNPTPHSEHPHHAHISQGDLRVLTE